MWNPPVIYDSDLQREQIPIYLMFTTSMTSIWNPHPQLPLASLATSASNIHNFSESIWNPHLQVHLVTLTTATSNSHYFHFQRSPLPSVPFIASSRQRPVASYVRRWTPTCRWDLLLSTSTWRRTSPLLMRKFMLLLLKMQPTSGFSIRWWQLTNNS